MSLEADISKYFLIHHTQADTVDRSTLRRWPDARLRSPSWRMCWRICPSDCSSGW